MTDFDLKVLDSFPGKVVRKDLTTIMKKGANVPTYVLEYLLGMYCATDDDEAIEIGLDKIKKFSAKTMSDPIRASMSSPKSKKTDSIRSLTKLRSFSMTVRINILPNLPI